MPRDWTGWVAAQRAHDVPIDDDKVLAKRIRKMERVTREQQRFAFKHLIITRTLLVVSLLITILVIGLLAGTVSTIMVYISWTVAFAACIVIVAYVIVRK